MVYSGVYVSLNDILNKFRKKELKFLDLRFCDTMGKEQHISIPASMVDKELLVKGKAFDGSSLAGWLDIHESDMILLPDLNARTYVDPFRADPTLVVRCDVFNPRSKEAYGRDPRTIAKNAEKHLKESGIADVAYFGPEQEFFVFDDVRSSVGPGLAHYEITSFEAEWLSDDDGEDGNNTGHRPAIKGGYFPVSPVDSLADLRSEMCNVLEKIGIIPEVHHHEVATAGQCEIGTRYNSLTKRADDCLSLKYIVMNVAHEHGKTATFMPKPLLGDNGSGMHIHMTLEKNKKNIFAGNGYCNLSQEALYFIGGIFKHIRAVNCLTNASANSYRRLIPGYEAPIYCAYSGSNRSASVRIPVINNKKATRIEMRFPDSASNPYLAFTALLMAGMDGVKNKIDPGAATELNLYDLSPSLQKKYKSLAFSLADAMDGLDKDRTFLTESGVMGDDAIDAYLRLKQKEVDDIRSMVHPWEIKKYYSL